MTLSRRSLLAGGAALTAAGTLTAPAILRAQTGAIRIGVLHFLSGTMAISETALKDVRLMLVEEQIKIRGVLGRRIEPVVVDPPRTGRCSPSARASSSASSASPPCSAAGPRSAAGRCCLCSRS
jgi:hypothetical protein